MSDSNSAGGATQTPTPPDDMPEAREIVIAFVRSLGTNLDELDRTLSDRLESAGFDPRTIKLSKLLKKVDVYKDLQHGAVHERYRTHMDLGDNFRYVTEVNSAVAVLGVDNIIGVRQSRRADPASYRGIAYIVKSLMHRDEVKLLRQIYGPQLIVVSASSPRETRLKNLATDIAASTGHAPEDCESIASEFLNRDAGGNTDPGTRAFELHPLVAPHRRYPSSSGASVDVARTFELADVFVSPTDDKSDDTLDRLVDLLFSNPFHTPTKDEIGMSVANVFAVQSAALSRRIGAAIFTKDGQVVAGGPNEVPKFGGGVYWAGKKPDERDFVRGKDSNDEVKREILLDFFRLLQQEGWLKAQRGRPSPSQLVERLLGNVQLKESRVLDVIEYARPLHAEMAALMAAARGGMAVQGCTMFTTTFPCHECARLIVASGIDRVVYIEAYPKSRVAELYDDSIGLAAHSNQFKGKVSFEPFVGIGPRRFEDLFSWVPRKKRDLPGMEDDLSGQIVDWNIATAPVRETIINPDSVFRRTRRIGVRRAEQETRRWCRTLIRIYREVRQQQLENEQAP